MFQKVKACNLLTKCRNGMSVCDHLCFPARFPLRRWDVETLPESVLKVCLNSYLKYPAPLKSLSSFSYKTDNTYEKKIRGIFSIETMQSSEELTGLK